MRALLHFFRRIRLPACCARGVQVFLVVLSSYAAARYTTGLIHPASAQFGALWAAISGIVALQDTLPATGHAARLRVWGTVVGAAASAGYLMLLPFSMTGLALAAGVAVAVAVLLQQKDGGRLAAITVTVIMLLTEMNPSQHPLVSVGMRLFEASLGAALAVTVSWAWARAGRCLHAEAAP